MQQMLVLSLCVLLLMENKAEADDITSVINQISPTNLTPQANKTSPVNILSTTIEPSSVNLVFRTNEVLKGKETSTTNLLPKVNDVPKSNETSSANPVSRAVEVPKAESAVTLVPRVSELDKANATSSRVVPKSNETSSANLVPRASKKLKVNESSLNLILRASKLNKDNHTSIPLANEVPKSNEKSSANLILQAKEVPKVNTTSSAKLVHRVNEVPKSKETSSANLVPQANEVSKATESSANLVPRASELNKTNETSTTNLLSQPVIDVQKSNETSSANLVPRANEVSTTNEYSANLVHQAHELPAANETSSDNLVPPKNEVDKVHETSTTTQVLKSSTTIILQANEVLKPNGKASANDTSLITDKPLNNDEFLESSISPFIEKVSNKEKIPELIASTQKKLGCNRISYIINTNRRNKWKAIPDLHVPVYSKVGYQGSSGMVLDIPEEKELECPPSGCILPQSYDSRKAYPMCTSLQESLDEGCGCRASWAVSAAAAFSDRFCMSTGGAIRPHLSAQQVLSCCEFCGSGTGCEGGHSLHAWMYFYGHGVVSGSQYGQGEGCQPYLMKPCMTEYDGVRTSVVATPGCSFKCQSSDSDKNQEPTLYKADKVYTFKNASVSAIKKEIFFRGPVTAEILVHEDFECYKSGIYRHVVGAQLGYKTVKLIGWGEENGNHYWSAANTWGSQWGEHGFFKIQMEPDNVNTEYTICAGTPLILKREM